MCLQCLHVLTYLTCGPETGFMFVVFCVVFIAVLESGDCSSHFAEETEVQSGTQTPRAWCACKLHPGQSSGCQALPTLGVCTEGESQWGGWYHGAEAGLEAGFLPQLWWVLDGTDHPWTRRALWFEDSDRDGLQGQYPVLGWQLGSPVTLPGDPDLAPTPPAVGTV